MPKKRKEVWEPPQQREERIAVESADRAAEPASEQQTRSWKAPIDLQERRRLWPDGPWSGVELAEADPPSGEDVTKPWRKLVQDFKAAPSTPEETPDL